MTAELAEFVAQGDLFVLTGAGLSTESGIPDYRKPDGTRRTVPMTFQQFLSGDDARRRYWVRSAVGWERFAAARPNGGHHAVAALQRAGLVQHLVTQNVDGLHAASGADALELHGSLSSVQCVECGSRSDRAEFQGRIRDANPNLPRDVALLADGDAEVARSAEDAFVLVACPHCGSLVVKPDVVMFGESVPTATVEHCYAQLELSRAVLVLGSSLKVMSGFRFVSAALKAGKPVALVGLGSMRGSERADLVLHEPLGATLTATCERLGLQVQTEVNAAT